MFFVYILSFVVFISCVYIFILTSKVNASSKTIESLTEKMNEVGKDTKYLYKGLDNVMLIGVENRTNLNSYKNDIEEKLNKDRHELCCLLGFEERTITLKKRSYTRHESPTYDIKFCIDKNNVVLSCPVKPELIGQSVLDEAFPNYSSCFTKTVVTTLE